MFSDVGGMIAQIAVWALPVIFAVTLHEAAHGYVAWLCGDDTAKSEGRLSLNPVVHMDPFGTVILPLGLLLLTGFAFGYAKPVPVNASRLTKPRRDMIWVALAGPGANLMIAMAAALMLPFVGAMDGAFSAWAVQMLNVMVFFNCLIAIFNMLPIPPLDGGRVAAGILPSAMAYQYEKLDRYGMLIVIGVLFLLPMVSRELGLGLDPGHYLILLPSQWLYDGIISFVSQGL